MRYSELYFLREMVKDLENHIKSIERRIRKLTAPTKEEILAREEALDKLT